MHSLIHSFVHLCVHRSFIHFLTHSFVHPLIHTYIQVFGHLPRSLRYTPIFCSEGSFIHSLTTYESRAYSVSRGMAVMGSLTEQWRRMAIASRTCIKWELPAVMTTGRCNLGGRRHSTTHNKAPELVRGIREAVAAGLRSKMSRNGPGHAVVMVLPVAAVGYGGRQHSRQSETTLRSLHQRRERAAFRKGERGAQPAWLRGAA